MKVLLAGNMARDAVVAERLAQEGCELHVASSIQNPSLLATADASKGQFYSVENVASPQDIAKVAVEAKADLFWTNQDDALANGVVDEVAKQAPDMLIASPNSESARIEWDKFETREIIADLDVRMGTSYNPLYFCATHAGEVSEAIDFFKSKNLEVAIKPRGLTGGKGVKVMGPHLNDYEEAAVYARQVIEDPSQGSVSIEEKLEGQEFTLQGFTDGQRLVAPPITYDYPQREDEDRGPGTGGMGSFTMSDEQLPFLDDGDYREALDVMRHMLFSQSERGRDFKGVLYGSFFKTAEGIKLTEFNARLGDPEGLNIVELLAEDTPLSAILGRIATQTLSEHTVRFEKMASTAVYLVSPDYGYKGGTSYAFELDPDKIAAAGCRAYFGAAEKDGPHRYKTTGASRTIAITGRALTPWDARAKIHAAIEDGIAGPLQYRKDIGDRNYIESLN